MYLYSVFARSVVACALFLTVAIGAVSASDYCSPCEQPDYCTPICTVGDTPSMTPTCTASCGDPSLARTNLPGWYSNDFVALVTSQRDSDIPFLIPTMNGFVETAAIPLTNPVDQYYATHAVVNGEVVQTAQISPTGYLASM